MLIMRIKKGAGFDMMATTKNFVTLRVVPVIVLKRVTEESSLGSEPPNPNPPPSLA